MADVNKRFRAEILDNFLSFAQSSISHAFVQYKKHRVLLIWSEFHLMVFNTTCGKIDVVYELHSQIQDVNSFKKFIIVLLDNGNFTLLDLPLSKKKKKKKDDAAAFQDSDNKNIFTDLLGDSAKKPDICEQKPYNTVTLDESSVIFSLPEAIRFVICGNCIVVLKCVKDSFYSLTCYNFTKLFGSAMGISEDIVKEDVLWQTTIECRSTSLTRKTDEHARSALKSLKKKVPAKSKLSMLTCYSENQTTKDQASISTNSCILNAQLFNSLFGTEVTLLECPVVLFSIPNEDTVYYVPLNLLSSTCDPSPTILYQLSQPISGILPVSVQQGDFFESDTNPPSASTEMQSTNCLLFLGLHGKLVSLYLGAHPSLVKEYECVVPGPIYGCTSVNNVLVHSDLLDTFCTSFWITKEGDLKNVECQPLGFHGSTLVASFGGNKECVEPLSVLDLLAVTHNGRMYQIESDIRGGTSGSKTKGGHQIKDLLTSLGNVSLELDKVNDRICHQDQLIQQLHLASILSTGYIGQYKCQPEDYPLSVQYKVECREMGVGQLFTLVIALKVRSGDFSDHWFVIVKVSSLMDTGTYIGRALNISKTVKFSPGISVNYAQEVRIDLDQEKLCLSLPMHLSVDLSLCVKPHEPLDDHCSSADFTRHLSVPCFSGVVDIIHVLSVSQSLYNTGQKSGVSSHTTSSPTGHSLDWSLQQRSSRAVSSSMKENTLKAVCKDTEAGKLETFNSIVQVEHIVVEEFLKQKRDNGAKSAESQLLQMLLADNPPVALGVYKDQSQIKVYTPAGNQVSLCAVSSVTESGRRNLEVHIQTFHPSDLCALREAVTIRLQRFGSTLDKDNEQPSASTQSMRHYLRELEEISSEVEALRHTRTSYSQPDVIRKMFHLFTALRNTDLKK